MPSRAFGSIRRLSGADLPVLPFLAPRFARQLHLDQESYRNFATHRRNNGSRVRIRENEPSLRSHEPLERSHSQWRGARRSLATSASRNAVEASSVAAFSEEPPIGSQLPNNGFLGADGEQEHPPASFRGRDYVSLPRFETPPRYVSLKPTYTTSDFSNPPILESLSTEWTRAFSAINSEYDHHNVSSALRRPVKFHRNKEHWVEGILASGFDRKGMSEEWRELSDSARRQRWPHIMLWSLQHSPEYALVFLEATHMAPFPPGYAVADSLDHIISYYFQGKDAIEEKVIDELIRAICLLLNRGPSPVPDLHQQTIYRLLQRCTEKQAITLYDALNTAKVPLHENTLLQFAAFFSRTAHFGRATRALQLLAQQEADLSSDKVLSVSVTLLRKSAEQGNGYSLSSRILAELLEIGLRPNLVVYNVIMLNAFEAGDSATGWRVHDLLLKNAVKPDKFTYSILMKEAKASANIEVINRIATNARNDGVLFNNPHVITELLGAIYAFHKKRKRTRADAFQALLSAFKAFFDIQPLVDLGLAPVTSQPSSTPESVDSATEKIEPIYETGAQKDAGFSPMQASPQSLTIMLTAFLERCPSHKLISQLFTRYRELIDQGHPLISQLAETDHTANCFLKGLGRFSETLHLCPMVIEQMLGPPTDSSQSSSHHGSPVGTGHRAEPTVQTWSILLYAFHRHGQPAAAEKVLSMMSKRGVCANQVTWNSLVNGYAQMQDVEGVVSAMKRMEQEGWEVDNWTLEGLGKVVDRKSLMDAFEDAEHGARNEDGHVDGSHDSDTPLITVQSDVNPEHSNGTPLSDATTEGRLAEDPNVALEDLGNKSKSETSLP
ncbi:hypothetical protein L228DRAFT_244484 [Xylona heveae TC161]|uniref:Pentatricopeptide repeat-containing protein-mitochondrial domain-containing protein n=1 Tax=Xylona heveae (strain CBS 132557 / TC161) TaxID=1328760 RepID=A0A165J072_XYLHT|nr:hypothetical protein L228DRAFT_244484 [Xylona heveae TC161]KZF25610.1 hypothetical protein L228DRAFT_244484 [Xylona heveae TC161]